MILKIIGLIAFLIVTIRFSIVFKEKIHFFVIGNDKGFKFLESNALWKLAKETGVYEPESLFYSLPLMSNAIIQFIANTRKAETEHLKKNQDFLKHLYDYRTRISLEHENNKGLDSSKYLDKEQKLRIVLPGCGVFQSEILENASELIIKTPSKKGIILYPGDEWVGKDVSVYLWRKDDAAYVFDTVVTNTDIYLGQSSLRLRHSNNMIRTQKRKSIRVDCDIESQLYFVDSQEEVDYNYVETKAGFRCLIENLSEDGALIRVGGKGVKDTQIKIQFNISDSLIIMYGIIRAVEYNKTYNQSRLHFECLHIEDSMKNLILSFVYNLLPSEEKEIVDALIQTEEDEKDSNTNNTESENFTDELDTSDLQKKLTEPSSFETSSDVNTVENLSDNNANVLMDDNSKVILDKDLADIDEDSENAGFNNHFNNALKNLENKIAAYNRS